MVSLLGVESQDVLAEANHTAVNVPTLAAPPVGIATEAVAHVSWLPWQPWTILTWKDVSTQEMKRGAGVLSVSCPWQRTEKCVSTVLHVKQKSWVVTPMVATSTGHLPSVATMFVKRNKIGMNATMMCAIYMQAQGRCKEK